MALNKRLIGWVFLALAAPCGHAQSEVYKCPDASGRPTYTNVKRDTWAKLHLGDKECPLSGSGPHARRAIFSRIGFWPRRATRTARQDSRVGATERAELLSDARQSSPSRKEFAMATSATTLGRSSD